jgi:acyl-CoA thioester hydrolase
VRYDPRLLEKSSYPVVRVLETMFSDMDVQRHVNNVAIARFFEEGRSALHYAIKEQYPGEFAQTVLATFEVHYLREVSYPGPVEVAVGAAGFGISSFRNVSAMFQDGRCVAVSWATHARRNADRTASQSLSAREREALATFAVAGGFEAGGAV